LEQRHSFDVGSIAVALSADGKIVAAGEYAVIVWDASTYAELTERIGEAEGVATHPPGPADFLRSGWRVLGGLRIYNRSYVGMRGRRRVSEKEIIDT
jgi:hypothetical protein